MAQNLDFNEVVEHFKKVVTTQFFCFDGRMSKRDFWMFMIPVIILNCLLNWTIIVPLALILPALGATARRLHDLGKTGWLQLLGLVCPPIGSIIVLVMCIPDGEAGENKYGPAPAAASAEKAE